jgi:excinuclease ABC subunit B
MYADRITGSMQRCLDETARRRAIQEAHNIEHGITPETIVKSIEELMLTTRVADAREPIRSKVRERAPTYAEEVNLEEWAKILEGQMEEAAGRLDFEHAARLRDELRTVRDKLGDNRAAESAS